MKKSPDVILLLLLSIVLFIDVKQLYFNTFYIGGWFKDVFITCKCSRSDLLYSLNKF